ncbi:MAG: exonuclease domain-containing protein [Sulfurovaceae bacterium]|nr:exonuclease domain-containing protein [Sulfurovaceae bacterium]MDD5549084.1 exonuclease domain-containing protein [Sulfurovaceae bacterium]
MKYVSIDIETTGLDPLDNQILEIGMVIEDTNNILPIEKLPRFHCYIKHNEIIGNAYAINMNRDIIQKIVENDTEKYQILKEEQVATYVYGWLSQYFPPKNNYIKITPAGKNFNAFDKLFLEQLPELKSLVRFAHRAIDPAVLCMDWKCNDELPTLEDCKIMCGLEKSVAHTAIEDALDVIRIMRVATENYTK